MTDDDIVCIEAYQGIIDDIYSDVKPQIPRGNNSGDERLYPERILQESEHGIKYYGAYQRHSRQFIDGATSFRWDRSTIEQIQTSIVEQSFGGTAKLFSKEDSKVKYNRPTSSALFSWSSDDAYIERRRKELSKKGRKLSETVEKPQIKDEPTSTSLVEKLALKPPSESVMSKLNHLVDLEANKFIHERIQVIKAHHSEQISQQINERKRRDHELHLQRLKQKEEQYEKDLRAATDAKEKEKSKFLGIFSFSNTDSVDSVDRSTVDLKSKRFSFLPPNIFGTKEERPESAETPEQTNADPEEPQDSVNTHEPDAVNSQPDIGASELDKVFQASKTDNIDKALPTTNDDDFDEFAEFTSSPPPQAPAPKVIKGHTLMPLSEPKPLIDFSGEEPEPKKDDNLLLL